MNIRFYRRSIQVPWTSYNGNRLSVIHFMNGRNVVNSKLVAVNSNVTFNTHSFYLSDRKIQIFLFIEN